MPRSAPVLAHRASLKTAPLTSIRFFAALFVVLYHGVPDLPSHLRSSRLLDRLISYGYVSVSFFFMLSGFILALVYLDKTEYFNPSSFLLSRFARIYPLYIAALAIDLPYFIYTQRAVIHTSISHSVTTFLLSVSLLQAWFLNYNDLNTPSWSLSAEAFFYFSFPIIGPLLWRWGERSLLACSLLIYCVGMGFIELCDHGMLHLSNLTFSPISHLATFALGICLAKLFARVRRDPVMSEGLAHFACYGLIAALAIFTTIPLFHLAVPEALLQHGMLAPLFGIVIITLASGNKMIMSAFSRGWLVTLGEASFALYLIHVPVFNLLHRSVERLGTPMFLVYLAIIICLSLTSLKWLEEPARNAILAAGGRRARRP